ncbi:MAG: DUF3276 family protein [Chitinophagales bacterium]|nr:DUF3276 family protein [Chitinophagales bacterium]
MEGKDGKYSGYFSKKLRAGKRRTYFFDVRSTKQGDFFLTITESKKKFDSDGYEMHKIFLYKEDFKKFMDALNETVDYIKQELLPDYDFDADRPPFLAKREDNHPSENTTDFSDDKTNDTTSGSSSSMNEEDMTWN